MIFDDVISSAPFRLDKMGKLTLAEGQYLFAGVNAFEPGQEHAAHVHAGQDKVYVVMAGEAEITLGEERRRVGAGAVAMAAADVPHGVRNVGSGRLVVLVVMGPPPR